MNFSPRCLHALGCVVLLATTVPSPLLAQDIGTGAIIASASIDSVITNVRNALQETISQAEAAGTVLSFRVATDAQILLQSLDAMATELSGKVFSDLNAAQQSALNNLLVLSQETTDGFASNIQQIDDAIHSAGEALSRIPGVSDRPFVSSYSPSYLLQQGESFDFSVNGSLLNSKKRHLTIGQTECKLLSSVEKRTRFSCPVRALGTGQDWVTGLLTLTQAKSWHQFWKNDDVYQYSVAIRAIPAEMGTYTLDATTRHQVEERINRNRNNEHHNDHCQGGREIV